MDPPESVIASVPADRRGVPVDSRAARTRSGASRSSGTRLSGATRHTGDHISDPCVPDV